MAGPLTVRDLVAGSGGVLVATVAIIAGCAFASASNLVWFAFWGIAGVLSHGRSVSLLRRAHADDNGGRVHAAAIAHPTVRSQATELGC